MAEDTSTTQLHVLHLPVWHHFSKGRRIRLWITGSCNPTQEAKPGVGSANFATTSPVAAAGLPLQLHAVLCSCDVQRKTAGLHESRNVNAGHENGRLHRTCSASTQGVPSQAGVAVWLCAAVAESVFHLATACNSTSSPTPCQHTIPLRPGTLQIECRPQHAS